MITTEPVEVVPVAHLVLELGLVGLATARPYSSAIPECPHVVDVTYGSVLQALDGFLILGLMVTLQTDGDQKVLFLGNFVGR